nr:DUF3343 domain-containing protein [Curtanaerobium respiraculi]
MPANPFAKTPKVVVTFASTADAIAMESDAQAYGLPGRIVPVPSEIDAGCGLAWCCDAADREKLVAGLKEFGIVHEGVFAVELY